MSTSPLDDAVGVLQVTIKSNGRKVADTARLLSVDIEASAGRIGRATLVYEDGEPGFSKLPLTDADTFKPGAKIEIAAAYESARPQTLFKGVAVAERLTIEGDNDVRLRVECRHEAVVMTLVRRDRVFSDVADSDVIGELLRDYGLSAEVDHTSAKFTTIIQDYATDWDFMVVRADANGLAVLADDSGVTVAEPKLGSAALTLTYGVDIQRFDGRVDASAQHNKAEAATWLPEKQAIGSQSAAAPGLSATGPGDLSASTLAQALGGSAPRLQAAAMAEAALQPLAQAYQRRTAFARNRAEIAFQGSSRLKPGDTVELKNVGKRFSGKAYVGAVRHHIVPGSWTTIVETGLDPELHIERHASVAAPPAAGRTVAGRGLQIGVVEKLANDPDTQNRIKVKLPLLDDTAPFVWARLASSYASSGFGVFVLPEIGDEVVVAFLDGDPAHAVIVGSLYSSSRAPAFTLTDENNTKAVVTRTDLRLVFNEEDKSITLQTPAGNKTTLDDKSKTITLKDENGNTVELSPSGIKIDSAKDVTISAKGKVDITAQMDVTAQGSNVSLNGQLGVKAQGGTSAELSAGGNTTVKGAMVMIN